MIDINPQRQEESFKVSGSEPCSIFNVRDENGISFQDDVVYNLNFQKTGKDLVITGSSSTLVTFECSRCIKPFKKKIELNNLVYTFSLEDVGDKLDLTPFVREEFFLVLPIMPVCSEKCRGLCPACGADLNTAACECHLNESGSAFDVLDGLIS